MKKPEELRPGDYVADLHYGWQEVRRYFDVTHICEFDFRDGQGGTYAKWVEWLISVIKQTKPYGTYDNKCLVIVATDPEIVAGWCYDGRHGGLVTLKPKRDRSARDGSIYQEGDK